MAADVDCVVVCLAGQAVGADDCQSLCASNARKLVGDAGGKLIDCCHAHNLRTIQSRRNSYFAFFLRT